MEAPRHVFRSRRGRDALAVMGRRADSRCWTSASVAGDGVAPQELGHRVGDGLGVLDV